MIDTNENTFQQSKSFELRPPPDFGPVPLPDSFSKRSTFGKRFDDGSPARIVYRNRSPMPMAYASTIAESRYALDAMRHSQYVSRYTLPPVAPPTPPPMLVPPVSQHQDYFLHELTAEVNECKGRQRDYRALQEQFRYLQEQYKQVQFEKQQFESDCLNKIAQDRNEVDILMNELD